MNKKNQIKTDGGQTPASRGIINEEGKEDRIPLIGWRKSDVIFIVAATLIGFFLIGPQTGGFWLPTTIVCAAGSLFTVYLKPKSLSVFEAIRIGFEYVKEPSVVYAAGEDADADNRNEGGLLNYTPFSPSSRTQDMVQMQMAFPEASAVLTEDGRMETMIEIDGANMDFAYDEEWAGRQQVGKHYVDRYVEDRVKIHGDTQPFKFGEVIDRIESRLNDEDIENTKVAQAVLDEYADKRPEQVEDRGTQNVSVYLIIGVTEDEVSGGYTEEKTTVEKLAGVPVIGRVARRFDNQEERRRAEENLYQNMIEKLDEMAKIVETSLINETKGYNPRRVSTIEHTTIIAKEFNSNTISESAVESIMQDTKTDAIATDRGINENNLNGDVL